MTSEGHLFSEVVSPPGKCGCSQKLHSAGWKKKKSLKYCLEHTRFLPHPQRSEQTKVCTAVCSLPLTRAPLPFFFAILSTRLLSSLLMHVQTWLFHGQPPHPSFCRDTEMLGREEVTHIWSQSSFKDCFSATLLINFLHLMVRIWPCDPPYLQEMSREKLYCLLRSLNKTGVYPGRKKGIMAIDQITSSLCHRKQMTLPIPFGLGRIE